MSILSRVSINGVSNFKGSILSKVTTLQGRFPSRDPWKRCRSVFKVEVGRPFKGVDVLFFKDVDFQGCRSFQGCRRVSTQSVDPFKGVGSLNGVEPFKSVDPVK